MTTQDHTPRDALAEAHRLVKDEFGNDAPEAAVRLAVFLYTARARQEFMDEHAEPPSAAYGAQ